MRLKCNYCDLRARPVTIVYQAKNKGTMKAPTGWQCPKCNMFFKSSEISKYALNMVNYRNYENYQDTLKGVLRIKEVTKH